MTLMTGFPLLRKYVSPFFVWTCLCTVLVFFLIATPSASAREVRVGVYENQPKVFTADNGRPAGIFIDIIEEIGEQEGWSLSYVHGSWAQCLERLDSGGIDLMVDIGYSPERAEKYDFCNADVISNWAQVYTRVGLDAKLITDLNGMSVATMDGDIHTVRLLQLAEGFGLNLNLKLVDSYETVFRMVHEKKVDAGVVNRIYGYAQEGGYDVVRSPVVFSPASLRFAVKKGKNGDLISAIDKRLSALKAEKGSVYHQSLRRWLGETTKLNLPGWVGWAFGSAASGLLFLFLLSVLLKYQVNKKTAHLQLANAQLQEQVSETMKAHLELKRSEERLISQERLSALGQLTSGIAHDFNNMLMPILGYSDLLLKEPELLTDSAKALPMLKSIQAAADTARETVRRLQEFKRADSRPKMEKVNVAEMVSEVVAATRPWLTSQREAVSGSVRILEDIPPDLEATLSKAQFREALMNLLLNALDAVSPEGEVIIRTYVENDSFILEVRDNGIGMPQEVVRQCLEPFFSTKGENGTGMGLAMVHGIVERHNGSLKIESTPGEGTSIAMQIPLTLPETLAQPDVEEFPLVEKALKVLVVDDDENSRTLISEYLAFDGHSVTAVQDTKAAMRTFDGGVFDLVITDRAMPELSGDHFSRHVKASDRPVPVLMVTGFAGIMASRDEHPEGVDCVIGKPFTLQELRNAIVRTLAR